MLCLSTDMVNTFCEKFAHKQNPNNYCMVANLNIKGLCENFILWQPVYITLWCKLLPGGIVYSPQVTEESKQYNTIK